MRKIDNVAKLATDFLDALSFPRAFAGELIPSHDPKAGKIWRALVWFTSPGPKSEHKQTGFIDDSKLLEFLALIVEAGHGARRDYWQGRAPGEGFEVITIEKRAGVK